MRRLIIDTNIYIDWINDRRHEENDVERCLHTLRGLWLFCRPLREEHGAAYSKPYHQPERSQLAAHHGGFSSQLLS